MTMRRRLTEPGKACGFTLVEVMIVVVIVAILATSAAPMCTGHLKTARMTEGIAGCGTIRTAMQVQRVRRGGKYPVLSDASGDDLGLLGFKPGELKGKLFDEDSYTVSSTETTYVISATYDGQTYSINHLGEEIGDFTVQ